MFIDSLIRRAGIALVPRGDHNGDEAQAWEWGAGLRASTVTRRNTVVFRGCHNGSGKPTGSWPRDYI